MTTETNKTNIIRNYGEVIREFVLDADGQPLWTGLVVTIRQRNDRFALLMDDDEMMAIFSSESEAIKAAGYVVQTGNLNQFYADDRAAKGLAPL